MSEVKHTPGPWIVFVGDEDCDVLPAGRDGWIAGQIENRHDADLIAAAPDLADLARNLAGIDEQWLENAHPRLVVAALRDLRAEARKLCDKITPLR